jgi:hypothetical protein
MTRPASNFPQNILNSNTKFLKGSKLFLFYKLLAG